MIIDEYQGYDQGQVEGAHRITECKKCPVYSTCPTGVVKESAECVDFVNRAMAVSQREVCEKEIEEGIHKFFEKVHQRSIEEAVFGVPPSTFHKGGIVGPSCEGEPTVLKKQSFAIDHEAKAAYDRAYAKSRLPYWKIHIGDDGVTRGTMKVWHIANFRLCEEDAKRFEDHVRLMAG